MADFKRQERELTTADLANKPVPPEQPERPKLVKSQAAETREETTHMPLFSDPELEEFRSQWSQIQTGFVDEPRRSVEGADKLVASLMQRIADGFANERSRLEQQWDRGDDVSTEDLRVALRRYRSFFDRLLQL